MSTVVSSNHTPPPISGGSAEPKLLPKKRKFNLYDVIENGKSDNSTPVIHSSSSSVLPASSYDCNDTNNNHIQTFKHPSEQVVKNKESSSQMVNLNVDLSEWIGHRVLAQLPNVQNTYDSGVIKSYDLNKGVGVELDSNHSVHFYPLDLRRNPNISHIISDCAPSVRQIKGVGCPVVAKCGSGLFRSGTLCEILESAPSASKSYTYRIQFLNKYGGVEYEIVSRANLRLFLHPWQDEEDASKSAPASSHGSGIPGYRPFYEPQFLVPNSQPEKLPSQMGVIQSPMSQVPKYEANHSVSVITMAASSHKSQLQHQPVIQVFNTTHCTID